MFANVLLSLVFLCIISQIKSNETSRVVLRPFYNSKIILLDRTFRLCLRFAKSTYSKLKNATNSQFYSY